MKLFSNNSALIKTLPLYILAIAFPFFGCQGEPGMNLLEPDYDIEEYISVLNIETGVTRKLAYGWDAHILPNSDRIFFKSQQGKLSAINIDSTEEKILINMPYSVVTQAFTSDGKKVVLRIVENNANKLYIMNSDGSGLTKIFDMLPPWDDSPDCSPNMDKILFSNERDLAIVDFTGNNYKVIKPKNDTSYYRHVKFLHDNDRIIFEEAVRNKNGLTIDNYILKVISLSKNTETILGNYSSNDGYEVSKNGIILATVLAGNWPQNWRARLIEADNNYKSTDILQDYAWNSISSDGKILVSSNLHSLHIMNTDGSNSRTVLQTNDSLQVTYPKITQDGKHIVYECLKRVPKK